MATKPKASGSGSRTAAKPTTKSAAPPKGAARKAGGGKAGKAK